MLTTRTAAYLAILSTLCACAATEQRSCQRPSVSTHHVFIYQPLSQDKVKVYRCLYKGPRPAYSDVSDRCLAALITRRFVDKWNKSHDLSDHKSPVIIEDQVARYADPHRNLLQLRSSTTCRYDRGFCYDPRESPDYAVVWKVRPRPPASSCDGLQQVFFGPGDFWSFPEENQTYLLVDDGGNDESFFVKLARPARCFGEPVWSTDRPGLVVALGPLRGGFVPAKKMGDDVGFVRRSKRLNGEAISKDCDLSAYGLRLDEEYLGSARNLRIVLEKFKGLIEGNRRSAGDFRKVLDRYRAVLSGKFKELNRVKVMLGLVLNRFDRFNGSFDCTGDLNSKVDRLNGSLEESIRFLNDSKTMRIEIEKVIRKLDQKTTKFEIYLNQTNANLTKTKIELIELIENFIESKSNEFDTKLTNYSTIILNDISLHSNNFLQSLNQLQTNYTYLKNHLNSLENSKPRITAQNLTSLNSSFSSRLNRTNFQLRNLENQLANYESLIGDKVDDSIKNVSEILRAISIETLAKIDSAANKIGRNCSDKIATSEKSTRELIERSGSELISLVMSKGSEEIEKLMANLRNYDAHLKETFRKFQKESIDANRFTQKSIQEISNNLKIVHTNHSQLDRNVSRKFDQLSDILRKEHDYFYGLISKIESEMDALPSRLDGKYIEIIGKMDDVEGDLRSEIDAMRVEIAEMGRKIGGKFIKVDFIDSLRRNFTEIFAKLENRMNDKHANLLKYLDNQAINATNKIVYLENELNSTIDYVSIINQSLIETNDSLKEKIDSNAANVQKLSDNFNELKFVFNITSLIDSKIDSSTSRTESILNTFKSEIASMDTDLKNLKTDLTSQKSNLSLAIEKNTVDIDRLKIDFNVLENRQLDESKSTRHIIDSLVKNATFAEKRIDHNENAMKNLEKQLEELKKSKETSEKRYEDNISDLRGLINEKSEEILYLKQQLSNSNKCCKNHDLKFTEKDKQIDELKKEIDKTAKEMKNKIDKIIEDFGMVEVEVQ